MGSCVRQSGAVTEGPPSEAAEADAAELFAAALGRLALAAAGLRPAESGNCDHCIGWIQDRSQAGWLRGRGEGSLTSAALNFAA